MERFKPALVRRKNITKTGQMAHELVLLEHMLASHRDEIQNFSMSEHMVEKYTQRKEELIVKLGIPEDKEVQKDKINTIEQELTERGYPYWRAIRPLP